jgi:hypothetical protein
MFVSVIADPPWQYRDLVHAARVNGVKATDYGFGADKIRGRRGAEGYYPTMTVGEICDLYVPSLLNGSGRRRQGTLAGYEIAEHAHLYLWTTNAFIEQAHQVCRAWGFQPRTILTWVKTQIGMGHYFRNNTEHVVFGVRGKLALKVKDQPTAFTAPRSKKHSEKPEAFYQIVERCSPGPYLELFARAERPNWTAWGFDVGTPRPETDMPRLPLSTDDPAEAAAPPVQPVWPDGF